MPLPNETNIRFMENMLIAEEFAYDKESLKIEHETLVTQLTDEQKNVYNSVMNDIDCNGGGLFFVYGYGGTGKTFVWRTLSLMIRSRGDIVLNVASSGIASLLLPGGRTAHSRIAIPLSLNEDSTCNISQGSDLPELIIRSKLIIWDEALMTHKHCFEALDKTMRDLLRFAIPSSAEKTFGGKTTNCKVLRLTKNLRLWSLASKEDRQTVDWFSKWIANIGDGITGVVNNGLSEIDIPPSSSVFKMQQKKQYLHELLREEQEPFQLNTYIADRRCENRRLPSPPKTSVQLKKCSATKRSLYKHACFFSFQDSSSSPDVRKSPLAFPSPLSASRTPNGRVRLNVPARTAALLLDAALRIQKQQQQGEKKARPQIGLGLFGSILKRLKD
ncbi:uncharacterized protein LOC115996005 [Ipomoea triloba]|uniref:uncharacterized protein LOC115996005 n=1 Tax=Ipomoea triloba TaxID=35885 RepID=UPI00125D4DFC|nr:uncharacterized protein LOC115996005 [Ipomoea triloba]